MNEPLTDAAAELIRFCYDADSHDYDAAAGRVVAAYLRAVSEQTELETVMVDGCMYENVECETSAAIAAMELLHDLEGRAI